MTFGAITYEGCFDAGAKAQLMSVNPLFGIPVPLSVNGPMNPNAPGYYQIIKAGILAMTLGAPIPVTDDGKVIVIQSTTAFAHTITATGLYNSGSAAVNLATFAAFAGASVTLQAFNGKWNVIASVGVTFS